MTRKDPKLHPDARLEQIHAELEALLDGESARDFDGQTVGTLEDIDGVVFALHGRGSADVRATQRPQTDAEVPPVLAILGELLDGLAQSTGKSRMEIAYHADGMMAASKRTGAYNQHAETRTEDPDG